MQTIESRILDKAMKLDYNLKLAATEMMKTEDSKVNLLQNIHEYINPVNNQLNTYLEG